MPITNENDPLGLYAEAADPLGLYAPPPAPVGVGTALKQGFMSTQGQAAKTVGKLAGLPGIEQWGEQTKAANAPVGEESLGATVGRGVGGLAGWLPAIAATSAVLPAAPEGAVALGLVRGMAAMAAPATSAKVNTTSELQGKVDADTAEKAGWAAAATSAASGAVPVGLVGGLAKRLASGAVSGVVVGQAGRLAQNAALLAHPELQEGFTSKGLAADATIGALLGGIMGPRKHIMDRVADLDKEVEPPVPPSGEVPAARDLAGEVPVGPIQPEMAESPAGIITPLEREIAGQQTLPGMETPGGRRGTEAPVDLEAAFREQRIQAWVNENPLASAERARMVERGDIPDSVVNPPVPVAAEITPTTPERVSRTEELPVLPKHIPPELKKLLVAAKSAPERAEVIRRAVLEAQQEGRATADYWPELNKYYESLIRKPLEQPREVAQPGARPAFALEPVTREHNDLAGTPEVAEPGVNVRSIAQRQGNLFAEPKPLTKEQIARQVRAAKEKPDETTPENIARTEPERPAHEITPVTSAARPANEGVAPPAAKPGKKAIKQEVEKARRTAAKQESKIANAVVVQEVKAKKTAAERREARAVKNTETNYANVKPEDTYAKVRPRHRADAHAWDAMRREEYGDSNAYPTYEQLPEMHRDFWNQGEYDENRKIQKYTDTQFRFLTRQYHEDRLAKQLRASKPEHIDVELDRLDNLDELDLKVASPGKIQQTHENWVAARKAMIEKFARRIEDSKAMQETYRKYKTQDAATGVKSKIADWDRGIAHEQKFIDALESRARKYRDEITNRSLDLATKMREAQVLQEANTAIHPEQATEGYKQIIADKAERGEITVKNRPFYDAIASGDTRAALKSVMDIMTTSSIMGGHSYATIARLLLNSKTLPESRFGESGAINDESVMGAYSSRYDRVTVDPGHFLQQGHHIKEAVQVYLHEVMHSATVNPLSKAMELSTRAGDVSKLTAEERTYLNSPEYKSAHAIFGIFEHLKQRDPLFLAHEHYGAFNPLEMVSEAFTNPSFQKYLKDITLPKEFTGGIVKSAWNFLIKNLKGMLGLRQVSDNALDAILTHGANVIHEEGSRAAADVELVGRQAVRAKWNPKQKAVTEVDHSIDMARTAAQGLKAPEQMLERGITGLSKLLKNLGAHSSSVLKHILPAVTAFHLAETFGKIAPEIKMLKDALDKRAGTHSSLEQQSAVIGNAANAWRRAVSSEHALEHAKLQQQSTLYAIDPRHILTEPLENQPWYKDLSRQHPDPNELAMAQMLAKYSYDHEVAYVKELKTPEYKAEYAAKRAAIEKAWQSQGRNRVKIKRGAGGKEEMVNGQDIYHREEFRLKQLALEYNDELVRSWYNVYHTSEIPEPRTENVKEMREQMRNAKGDFSTAARAAMVHMDESRTNIMAGPYFHMFRPGDFYVKYKGESGRTYLESFETEAEARKAWDAKIASGEADKEGFRGGRWAEIMHDGDITNSKALNDFIDRATLRAEATYGKGTEQAKKYVESMRNIMEHTALASISHGSNRTASSKRTGYEGASLDMGRSFATRTIYSHNAIATLRHAREANEALLALGQRAREAGETLGKKRADPELQAKLQVLHDELQLRHIQFTKPVDSPILDTLTNLNYNFYLAMSPAYLIRNLTQPFMLTLPHLGGIYGFVDSSKALARHTGTAWKIVSHVAKGDFFNPIFDMNDAVIKGLGLRDDQVESIKMLAASGKADATFAYNTGAIARGQNTRLNAIARMAGVPAHYTEVVNRIATALAAHDLEYARTKKALERSGKYDTATIEAKARASAHEASFKAVDTTQMDYTPTNRARWLGKYGIAGAATPLLTAFQQFNLQSLEFMSRMAINAAGKDKEAAAIAKKQMALLMATTSIVAGTMGVPFANAIAGVYDKLNDDPLHPSDIKADYRTWLSQTFGPELGEVFAHGAPRAVGAELSQGTGLQDIMPFTQFLADRRAWKDRLDTLAAGAAGPAFGILENVGKGADQIANGHIWKGIESMAPHAITGAVKSAEMGTSGTFTDAKGNPLPMPGPSAGELAWQAVGITPARLAEEREASFGHTQHQALLTAEKTRREQAAIAARGTEDWPDALSKVKEWNVAHPDMAIKNLAAPIRAQAKKQLGGRLSGTGVPIMSRQMPGMANYSYGNVGLPKMP